MWFQKKDKISNETAKLELLKIIADENRQQTIELKIQTAIVEETNTRVGSLGLAVCEAINFLQLLLGEQAIHNQNTEQLEQHQCKQLEFQSGVQQHLAAKVGAYDQPN